jgi:hypothetical protein
MQRQPFLRLLDAVVMKFVIHPSRAQRVQQIASHSSGKLAVMNGYVSGRRHPLFVAEMCLQDKLPQAGGDHRVCGKI